MRVFINAKTETLCGSIASALEDLCCETVCCFDDTTAAETDLSDFDTVIVSTPLRTEFGLNYIADVHNRTKASIVVLAKTDVADDVQNRVRFTGAFVLPRPFSKSSIIQTVKMSVLAKENMQRLREENTKLSQKLNDDRIINRAKCCLIQYLNFTEEQAQEHIRRLAMDRRITMKEVAEDILRTYGGMTNI